MPDFLMTYPDGRRFKVSAPEGMSQDDMTRELARTMTHQDLDPAAEEVGRRVRQTGQNLLQRFGAPVMAAKDLTEQAMSGTLDVTDPATAGKSFEVVSGLAGGAAPFAERAAVGAMGGKPAYSLEKARFLPSGESLAIPPAPTVEQMKALSRSERVPLEAARSTQSKMDWIGIGERPPELISGYGDKPVAVKKENGEYLIFDGHHRIVNAINSGMPELDMHVIDAKSYAPEFAGRKPARRPSITDDELLRQLNEPDPLSPGLLSQHDPLLSQ